MYDRIRIPPISQPGVLDSLNLFFLLVSRQKQKYKMLDKIPIIYWKFSPRVLFLPYGEDRQGFA